MAINAGIAEKVVTGKVALLWATTSTGTVTWTQTSGPTVTMSGSGAQRWFTPTAAATYAFSATNGTDTATKQIVAVSPATSGGTTYSHSGLPGGSLHTYSVATVNAAGTGAFSPQVSATTQASSAAVPAVPTGLTADPLSYSTIRVTWSAVSGATGYSLKVDGTNVDVGNSTAYSHANLSQNTTHNYAVAASNSSGTSAFGGTVSATTPSAQSTWIPNPLGPVHATVRTLSGERKGLRLRARRKL